MDEMAREVDRWELTWILGTMVHRDTNAQAMSGQELQDFLARAFDDLRFHKDFNRPALRIWKVCATEGLGIPRGGRHLPCNDGP